MAAIKFSKQYVDPNPNEVDYWIDLTSNPYGGKIKYNNGIDWVDLIGSNGNAVDFDNYFNKDQINEMLSNKASVDSVESKVDDTEIAEIIKNIEIKDRGNSGVELVLLKYDDTTIGVTMPIASSTTSGVVTSDDFKNLVKQYKLQEFYTEMYEKLADIRNSYQPKLKAGKNITIDKTTNTIHATGKLSTEWKDLINVPDFKPVATSGDYNDLINKPDETIQDIKSTLNKEIQDRKDAVTTEINDRINAVKTEETRAIVRENELSTRIDNHFAITDALIESKADKSDTYTKNQIDQKLSGVYRIKGSCSFEQLPLTGNTAGDVYIITNAFTLNGVEYPVGTNVVYTENGWVALSGMFDMTELENEIQNVSINLTNEIVRATEAEQLNATNITNIDNRLKNAEESLNTINGDELTTGSIAKVIKDTKDHTDSSVTTEKNRAIEAENKIASDLSTAKTDIHNQISSINETLSTEISAREASDTTISTDLTNEINRATTRENKIEQDYIASVQGLQFNISTLSTTVNDVNTSLTNKINIVDGKLVNYLPLSGGTISSASYGGFNISRDGNGFSSIKYSNSYDGVLGYIGIGGSGSAYAKQPTLINDDGTFVIWNGTNFNPSDYLPLSGGVVKGMVTIKRDATIPLYVHSTDDNLSEVGIRFTFNSGNAASIAGKKGSETLWRMDSTLSNKYQIWDSGNDGRGSGLDADKLDGVEYQNILERVFSKSFRAGEQENSATGWFRVAKSLLDNESCGIIIISRSYGYTNNESYIFAVNMRFGHASVTQIGGTSATRLITKVRVCTKYNDVSYFDLYIGVSSAANSYFVTTLGAWESINPTYNPSDTRDTIDEFAVVDGLSGDLTGSLIGNASSATKLQTAQTIWGQSFDGTGDVSGNVKGSYFTIGDRNNAYIELIGGTNFGYVQILEDGSMAIGSKKLSSIIVTKNGSVGIGTTIPTHKLDVNGSVSGDFVDWYGVSWSENSSNPTCTRIGNMAMHKSLPILSAMKGYYISNINNRTPETIIPINESWTNLKYDLSTNDSLPIDQIPAGNIMVKIPEFWYIDDYEPSTKTHNLKISQTAKAGWCHHKEAYVGAYEGYDDDTYYRSKKGVLPTVSVTRTDLRPLARANGFEGESKWNIYTYEEHRAICHLFLVEYATRNSQAPVNTALTADGFRQGGLGPGCTTGAMNNTYSFIPTGTTDSLGNGSGQVAYTASNGVTYYANRYRGIENPFGHIFKHVDDIINVYNAETAYKTVYKCNKPEHFATNKNAKYKPLCSFPGGSKIQGYSKEIKATINCDFFKYSVGGSESTYWCDYNYDNDNTTEHCLLIGGSSDGSGRAGLFDFDLTYGVGYSYVNVGSRLTYLPWAE